MDLAAAVNKSSDRFRTLTTVASILHSCSMHCYSHREEGEWK